ncbi:hypothetical protein NE237_025305 [Protea cynaroides]|uniref:Uncharacterized protein n=1 Tax=Protea cynaroides TaxID=273540 RepID=A0A9Q0H6T8_9MAGN|nr:hypothetical protein NE237_025305 [Protea cynaroides]
MVAYSEGRYAQAVGGGSQGLLATMDLAPNPNGRGSVMTGLTELRDHSENLFLGDSGVCDHGFVGSQLGSMGLPIVNPCFSNRNHEVRSGSFPSSVEGGYLLIDRVE